MPQLSVRRATAKNSNKYWDHFVTITLPSKLDKDKPIDFNIHVYDTGPSSTDVNQSVVVAIHGMPGTGHDFTSLASNLHSKGIRFIAPTSIGMETSPMSLDLLYDIDFSTVGRTKALQHTLKALNIDRIDLLIAHSAGGWTLYEVGAKWNNVGSLLTINPGGACPNRSIRPYSAIKAFSYILNSPLGRMLAKPFINLGYKFQGFKEIEYGDHLIATHNYISSIQIENVPENAATIRAKAIPFVMMYSTNDRLIESHIYRDMAYSRLGIPVENTVHFTKEAAPNKNPVFVPPGWLSRVLVFARGGHIVHLAHEDEVVQQIQDLLRHVVSGRKRFK